MALQSTVYSLLDKMVTQRSSNRAHVRSGSSKDWFSDRSKKNAPNCAAAGIQVKSRSTMRSPLLSNSGFLLNLMQTQAKLWSVRVRLDPDRSLSNPDQASVALLLTIPHDVEELVDKPGTANGKV